MSDLSTFTRAKDWIIVTLAGLIFTLLAMWASDNRRRIDAIEIRQERSFNTVNDHSERIGRIEEILASQRQEIGRRLERIEDKVDRISSRQNGK
jgi:predicted P-loop ATPase/GTPase